MALEICCCHILWEFLYIKLFYHCIYMLYLIWYMFCNSNLCMSQRMIFYIVCMKHFVYELYNKNTEKEHDVLV